MRPVLLVTSHAPPERAGAFSALHERVGVEVALFGGRSRHGASEAGELPFPHRRVSQRQVAGLAASGRYRAVIAGTVGRLALPAAYAGARRAGVPFLLWSALWAHPRTPAGVLGWPLLHRVYRRADAVVTYGPHVSEYVRARGATNVHEAPQAVDNEFWSGPAHPDRKAPFGVVFAGRVEREKGVQVLIRAWRASGLRAPSAALVLVGGGPVRARAAAASAAPDVILAGPRSPEEVRNFYAGADVLVLPSLPTRAFREPWGLVVNEAMNQGLAIVASDAVGAVAGGLVRHGRNGLVCPAGDERALAAALRELHDDPDRRARLGEAGRQGVRAHTFDAWADGFQRALASVGAAGGG